jgi:SAM-dependent methyltransferase
MARRAASFGDDADAYDRERPSYPAELVDEVLRGSPRRVLDIGCGTGKAGSLLLARGCAVLGVEADPRMAAVARRHGLDVEVSRFEEWDPGGRHFDLAIAGQAWHWIDPVRGAAIVAAALRPGARLALFWNRGAHDPQTQAALDTVYSRLAPSMDRRCEAIGAVGQPHGDPHEEVIASGGGFGDPERFEYRWAQEYPRERWLELISTHSDHRVLPDERRAELLAAVGDVVDRLGGSIRLDYRTTLTCWRRLR